MSLTSPKPSALPRYPVVVALLDMAQERKLGRVAVNYVVLMLRDEPVIPSISKTKKGDNLVNVDIENISLIILIC